MNRNLKNQNGYTLTLVLFALALITILGLSLFTVTTNSMKLSFSERNNQATYYIAEAGLTFSVDAIESFVENTYNQLKDQYDLLTTEQQRKDFKFKDQFYTAIEKELSKTGLSEQDSPTIRLIDSYKEQNGANNLYKHLDGNKPTFSVSVTKSSSGDSRPLTYKLESTGKIGNQKRAVTQEVIVTHLFNDKEESEGKPTGPSAFEKKFWGSDVVINKDDKTIKVNSFKYNNKIGIDLSDYYDNSWNLIINGSFDIIGNGSFIFPGSVIAKSSHINSHSCVKVGNTFSITNELKAGKNSIIITDFYNYSGDTKHVSGEIYIISKDQIPQKSCSGGNKPPAENNNDSSTVLETDQYITTSQPYEID